ncbi:MAG TPA: glycerate kinase [Naasia sp.]|jgi:glycerate kinase
MKVVVAPDSFKGTIGAARAAQAIYDGWRSVRPSDEVILRPMADGGEGTLAAVEAAVPGSRRMPVMVDGPDGARHCASWLLLPASLLTPAGGAVVERGETSGIELIGDRRLPGRADTLGFGQAIAAALDYGVSQLMVAIGSSASTDGGVGLLTALGAHFTDGEGAPIGPGADGLATVHSVDISTLRRPPPGGVAVLTDVRNPLLGPNGAAAVFGPQKGLNTSGIARAEHALRRLASLLNANPDAPGAGAGGGTGFGLLAWGATLQPGAAQIAQLIGLGESLACASLVITGEGSFDGQSTKGKVPSLVLASAAEAQVPVALVAGRILPDANVEPFLFSLSLSELAGSRAEAIREPARWLQASGASLARSLGAATRGGATRHPLSDASPPSIGAL